MDYRKTFVRIKGERHFDQVVKAYRKAGAIPSIRRKSNMGYIRCDSENDLKSGSDAVLKEYTVGYTELILRNGQLVPAVKRRVDWTKRYVRVNGQVEYDAAIAAFVKLTGMPIISVEKGMEVTSGFVGLGAIFGEVMSAAKNCSLRGAEAQLTDLLKAAGIDLPKPKLDREYKKGDKVRVTATPSPTYSYFSVGDVATLSRFDGRDWRAVFASGREWCLQPSIGTRYEFFNESKPKDRCTRIIYKEYPDGSREITKIENCLTREECEKVAPGYLDGEPHYYLDGKDIVLRDSCEFRFRTNSKVLHDNVQDNAQIDSDFWPEIMRKAGERFVACKKAAAEKAAAEKAAAEKAKPKIVEVVI